MPVATIKLDAFTHGTTNEAFMIILSEKDLRELQILIGDFRYKEAMAIIQFINARGPDRPNQGDQAPISPPPPQQNGHASEQTVN